MSGSKIQIGALVQRKCSTCEEEIQNKTLAKNITPLIQRSAINSGGESIASDSVCSKINCTKGGGSIIEDQTRTFMESRFGSNFSKIKIHTDSNAIQLNKQLNAQAFTVGNDIYFNEGKYNPNSNEGKHLLAHELTHTIQQGGLQKIIQKKDALCKTYNETNKTKTIDAKINSLSTIDVEKKLQLIQDLKWIIRCGNNKITKKYKSKLHKSKIGKMIWLEATSAFGGYRGMYPSYYSGAKRGLKRLGVREVNRFGTVLFDNMDMPKTKAGLKKQAQNIVSTMKLTDILYFYGHHYAQYKNPGVFSNGSGTKFIDFRRLKKHGSFNRVKLMISTSCATICKEAIQVFKPIFPNVIILGYRKSAPLKGSRVRTAFYKGIKHLNKPLLLGESIDMNSIINVWKSVVKQYHPNEKRRLPGYYKGGKVYYLESGKWKDMLASDINNSCKKKGRTINEAIH